MYWECLVGDIIDCPSARRQGPVGHPLMLIEVQKVLQSYGFEV